MNGPYRGKFYPQVTLFLTNSELEIVEHFDPWVSFKYYNRANKKIMK